VALPVGSNDHPELQRLGSVIGLHVVRPGEISDRARHFTDTVVGASRESQSVCRRWG
jgi:hypothetical protein